MSETELMDVTATTSDLAKPIEEKTLPVSQVNQIVAREKREAQERARREYESKLSELEASRDTQSAPQAGIGGIPQEAYSSIKEKLMEDIMAEAKKAEEEYQKEQQKEAMKKVAENYFTKLQKGKEIYQDFDEVLADFNPRNFPQVVYLASELDNTPEIIYELSKNPGKLANLNALAQADPEWAKKEMKKLSESIATNRNAIEQNQSPNAPLNRLSASSKVGGDTGQMTLKDFKSAKWLKHGKV